MKTGCSNKPDKCHPFPCDCCCKGPKGDPGPMGPQGIPGPQGPGVEPAYFNAVYIGGSQDVPPESDVNFLLSFQSGDFSFTPNTSEITVNTSGVYRIDYSLTIRPSESLLNVAYAVAINDFENPLSFFGLFEEDVSDTKRVQLNGMFLAAIDAGSIVALRNKSATEDILAGTGVNNQAINRASIIIQRIDN